MAPPGAHARARGVDLALGAHARRPRRVARVRAARGRGSSRGLAARGTVRRLRRVDARGGPRRAAARREPGGHERVAHPGRFLRRGPRVSLAAGGRAVFDRPLHRRLGGRALLHRAGRPLSGRRRRRGRPVATALPQV